jgi:glycyl-tRNA synthetase beta subunit
MCTMAACRRAATGVACIAVSLQTLVSNKVSLSLSAAVALAAAQQPLSVTQQQQDSVLDFVGRRLEQLLIDAGVSAEAGVAWVWCIFLDW